MKGKGEEIVEVGRKREKRLQNETKIAQHFVQNRRKQSESKVGFWVVRDFFVFLVFYDMDIL